MVRSDFLRVLHGRHAASRQDLVLVDSECSLHIEQKKIGQGQQVFSLYKLSNADFAELCRALGGVRCRRFSGRWDLHNAGASLAGTLILRKDSSVHVPLPLTICFVAGNMDLHFRRRSLITCLLDSIHHVKSRVDASTIAFLPSMCLHITAFPYSPFSSVRKSNLA